VNKDAAERAGALIEGRAARAKGAPAQASPPASVDEEGLIQNLKELRDAGILNEEEFEAKLGGVTRREEAHVRRPLARLPGILPPDRRVTNEA
jgi:hypothetical protein